MHSGVRLLLVLAVAPVLLAAPVTVSVVDGRGVAVENAYVAIVAADSPWRSPIAETVAQGGTARFDVPAVPIRIVAAAPGYVTQFGEPMPPGTARVTLERLGFVAGMVVDADGRPVAQARVGSYFDRLPDHPRRLSALGRKHLQGDTLALTDDDGLFELRVPLKGATAVLVEADRMSPMVVDQVTAGSDRLSRVVLQCGASLQVQGESAPLELIPVAASLHPSLPSHRAVRLWVRPAGGSWPSLPPGIYDIATRAQGAENPVILARVTLAAGETRTVPVATPAAKEGDVRLMLGRTVAGPITVRRWRGREAASVTANQDGQSLTIAGCAAGDLYVVSTSKAIGSARVASCTGIVPVELHERAELRVRFETPEIAAGTVRAATCDDKATRMEIPFAADRGVTDMPLPAGCSSLSVSAKGYAATSLGTANVAAGARHEVVVKNVQRAAALLVRVLDADRRPAPGARVVAVQPDALQNVRSLEDLGNVARIADGKSSPDGWVSFPDLPHEPIRLLVFTPDGRVATITSSFLLTRGAERIEQVTLDAPGSVRVQVVRDSDSAEVDLRAVTLRPGKDSPWPPLLELAAPAGTDGAASFDVVPPGLWIASANARLRRGNILTIGRSEVFVPPGGWMTASLSFGDLVYRARITGAAVPDGAVVLLQRAEDGNNSGNQSAMVEGGRFKVLLDRPGTFRVSIQRRDGTRTVVPKTVTFESAGRELEILLGSGTISGIVENVRGEPLANVRVEGIGEGEALARSDANGVFTLDALPAGRWRVYAWSESERSDTAEVAVADTPVTGVRLVMRERRVIRGTLRNANGGPVADATVFVDVFGLPGQETLIARTDGRGVFELKDAPPERSFVANVVVALTMQHGFVRRMDVRDGLTLQVPAAFGIAVLHRADEPWTFNRMQNHVLVAPDGSWFHPLRAGRIQDRTLTVRLVPGVWRYVIVRTPADRLALRSGNGLALAPLTTFVVDVNRPVTVELRFDGADQEKR